MNNNKKKKQTVSLAKYKNYLDKARTATLGTHSPENKIHLVPIVFASSSRKIYFAIDRKRKQTTAGLQRLKNLRVNPSATLIIHNYSEDWSQLSYLTVYSKAKILGADSETREKRLASSLLKEKYTQYRDQNYLPEELQNTILVSLEPYKLVYWQNSHHSLA